VCLLMPKSLPAIVSILGIFKADYMYVPIDPQRPAPRVRKIIDQGDGTETPGWSALWFAQAAEQVAK